MVLTGVLTAFVVVLASLGLYNSAYFTLLTYNLISPAAPLVPAVCRLDDGACTNVVHTPSAKVIAGVPNALFGVAYYVAMLIAAATGLLWQRSTLLLFVFASATTVALGLYLTYQLIAVMRVRCVLCITSHVINAVLMIVFVGVATGGR